MKPDAMKITTIETFDREPVCIVRVRTEDGREGFGQTAPGQSGILASILHHQLAQHALGRDATEVGAVVDACVDGEYKWEGPHLCRALAGLDTALWDLRGKLAGKSVCELLGGRPRPFPVYASSMRRDIAPADEAERLARPRDEQGFAAFKFRIGRENGHDADEWPGRTEAIVPAVRAALGDDVALLVDANGCYTPRKAIEVGRFLEQHGVCHFEEPCPFWELEWTAEVAAAL